MSKQNQRKVVKELIQSQALLKKGNQVEETPIAEDCNKEGFREDFQKVGPYKIGRRPSKATIPTSFLQSFKAPLKEFQGFIDCETF